jgi:hypothetical protein
VDLNNGTNGWWFWSSTPVSEDAKAALVVSFETFHYTFSRYFEFRNIAHSVRLVRSGQ